MGLYFNRDLSWIDFNSRVMEEGLRKELPPLERFRFLSIVSSNFDEFFMVRVAGLKRILRSGGGPDPSGLSPAEQLREISKKVRAIIEKQYACLGAEVFPALGRGGLELLRPAAYTGAQREYLESYFFSQVYPILTPLRIEDERALPSIDSFSMNAAFLLAPDSRNPEKILGGAESRAEYIAMVQIPPVLNRFIPLQ
jgi:polyphosphate kinase